MSRQAMPRDVLVCRFCEHEIRPHPSFHSVGWEWVHVDTGEPLCEAAS